jgi:hypothetical protein
MTEQTTEHSDTQGEEPVADGKKWVTFLQVRNNPDLDSNMKRILGFLPRMQKTQIVEQAIALFADVAEAASNGDNVIIERKGGIRDRLYFIGATRSNSAQKGG